MFLQQMSRKFDEAVNNIFTEDIEKRMNPYRKTSKIHVFSF